MADLLILIGAMATAILAVCGLLGLGVRYVLLPWLREHLLAPVLQRLDSVAQAVEGTARDVRVAATMFDGHIERSAEDRGKLWDAIQELWAAMPRRHRRKTDRNEQNRARCS